MNHIDENLLYKFALELLDSGENMKLRKHIDNCVECRGKLLEIKDQIAVISDFDPHITPFDNPLIKKSSSSLTWLKRAAVIIIGILISYAAVDIFNTETIVVSGQKFTPKNSSMDSLELVESQNVDLYTEF
jgi:hypothetical protein